MDTLENAIAYYDTHKTTMSEIEKKFGVERHAFAAELDARGIARWKRRLSEEDKRDIICFYRSRPMTVAEAANAKRLSCPTLLKLLSSHNVPQWNRAQIFSPDMQEDYFDKINTERKAYFLGLLLTDGCIYDGYRSHTHQKMISLALQAKDSYLLDELRSDLKLNKRITDMNNGCKQLQILSTDMANSLSQYGVFPRKSGAERFPTNIDSSLVHHVLRGIFDGDGSAAFYAKPNNSKRHSKAIVFCSGGAEMLEDIAGVLKECVGVEPRQARLECNGYVLRYGSQDAIASIIEFMYADATICMERKKKTCDLILEEIRRYRGN